MIPLYFLNWKPEILLPRDSERQSGDSEACLQINESKTSYFTSGDNDSGQMSIIGSNSCNTVMDSPCKESRCVFNTLNWKIQNGI